MVWNTSAISLCVEHNLKVGSDKNKHCLTFLTLVLLCWSRSTDLLFSFVQVLRFCLRGFLLTPDTVNDGDLI